MVKLDVSALKWDNTWDKHSYYFKGKKKGKNELTSIRSLIKK